jgi:hypothetical protein
MYKLFYIISVIFFISSILFLSKSDETWRVTQYKHNSYIDPQGKRSDEYIPVNVEITESGHELGTGMIVLCACTFLSGVYLYTKKKS